MCTCRLNGYANGYSLSPHAQEESNSVLSWAYPPVGSPPAAKGEPHRPGSASKHRHAKHSVPAYGAGDHVNGAHLLGAGLCLAGLAGHSICEGWGAAYAIVSDGSGAQHVALPLYMTSALKGAAASVLAGALCKQTSVQGVVVSAAIAALMPTAALICLAQVPLGDVPASFLWDPSAVTEKATTAIAGALLVLSLQVLMPIATRTHRQSSLKGLFSGAACAGVVFAVKGFLCMISVFCIH